MINGGLFDLKDKEKRKEILSMDKEKDFEYTSKNKDEVNMVQEKAAAYGVKRQGEYTLEDYYAIPDERRVELIDGVIYDMAAPTSVHQILSGKIFNKLDEYVSNKKGTCIPIISPIDVQLDCDDKTMVQPDVVVICDRSKIIVRCIYGAPDFVVEIQSSSTAKKDAIIKLRKYKAAGVREYWMVDPDKKKIVVYDWNKSEIPIVYGFDDKVPVGIFTEECKIDFAEIYEQIAFLYL